MITMYIIVAILAFYTGTQVAKSIAILDEAQVEKIEMKKKEAVNEK
jgi:hypothetical protein